MEKKAACDKEKLKSIQGILLIMLAVLVIGVIGLTLFSHSTVTQSRAEGDYRIVQNVTMKELDRQREYRFMLESVDHAEILAFFLSHHEITVYVGDQCIYSLTAKKNDVFTTTGGVWVMLPLYESDEGKEVRVVLTALYNDYTAEPEFLVGSEIAIHNVTLHQALPALILSLCVMFTGLLLICLAVYHSVKGVFSGRLYALGMLAISAGLWRIAYDRIAYLLLPHNTVLVYTASIISIMGVALSMLNSLQTSPREMKAVRICSCGYCGVYILQLLLQAFGIADLRQTLKLVHITIIISAVAFVVISVKGHFQPKAERKGKFGWILGAGVLIDLLLYYFSDTAFHMVFTLVAILCYAVLEGIQLIFSYVEQEKALEEMKKDLILSRTTTMMSQIRSHFVFNVLNAISGMCKYDPGLADETVVRFARYLRNNIDIMEKDGNIPFATDLQQLEDYVALEQVRFGDKIEFYIDIEADNFMIPPLILQPVVENAIKHGVSKKMGSGYIILRTREDENSVIITVEDDGVGFDMAELEKEKSVGVRNIRFRLEHLVRGKLDIQSEVGKGTTVTITIPKEGN